MGLPVCNPFNKETSFPYRRGQQICRLYRASPFIRELPLSRGVNMHSYSRTDNECCKQEFPPFSKQPEDNQ